MKAQSRLAVVNSGAHLIKVTDWSKFRTVDILVESIDGSKRKVYKYSTVRAMNPTAIHVLGIDNDFAQGTEVAVYVLKPTFSGIKSNSVRAKVDSGSHLIKAMDWSIYRNCSILVEEVSGLNQNLYHVTSPRNINPVAMNVHGIDEDYEQGTDVFVYTYGELSSGSNNIGIDSANPDEKLTVNGTIHSNEVKVDLNVPPDYVFEKYYSDYSTVNPNYKMLTLEDIEAYIKINYHLPNIPSAKEIKANGLYIKEMTSLLLQKVEELTLYTLEQENKIKNLENQNSKSEKENELLKSLLKRVSILEKEIKTKK